MFDQVRYITKKCGTFTYQFRTLKYDINHIHIQNNHIVISLHLADSPPNFTQDYKTQNQLV